MRISEAARRLGTSARMLRYREDLGLLPRVRDHQAFGPGSSVPRRDGPRGPSHRAGPPRDGPRGPSHRAGPPQAGPRGPSHRQFGEADLEAVAAALELERRYDISPASLAFGLRVLAEPGVRAAVADLGRRLGRIPAPAGRALDFEKERALRLLSGRWAARLGPGQ
jgi:MerR family transcriptional regulator, copper efflux regulator